MKMSVNKSYRERTAIEKTMLSTLVAISMIFVFYLYVCILSFALKSYPAGIAWLKDITVHSLKFDSTVYTMYGFFLDLFILGYPIIFTISMVVCILFAFQWKGKIFGTAFLFPGMFGLVTTVLSCVGQGLL